MIINSDNDNMSKPLLQATPQDSPPSYDYATEAGSPHPRDNPPAKPQKHGFAMAQSVAGPSYSYQPLQTPPPTVYNYVNPHTGEQIVSLLPPNHPEMICLQAGSHITNTQYGLLGILAAIFWFPLGIGLCLLDRRVICSRCGAIIDDGICG